MPYATIKEQHGRRYSHVDIQRFATDLCAKMGGADLDVRDERASFMVGPNLLRLFTSRYETTPKVSVRIEAPDVSTEDKKWNGGRQTESASVNPDARSIDKIAADIQRRVIDNSAEALTWMREKSAEYVETRKRLVAMVPDLLLLGVTIQPEDNGLALRVLSEEPSLVSAKVTTSRVDLQRLQGLTHDQFKRIMAIVNEAQAEDVA